MYANIKVIGHHMPNAWQDIFITAYILLQILILPYMSGGHNFSLFLLIMTGKKNTDPIDFQILLLLFVGLYVYV